MAFGKVYCFGPTFRAEKSKTRRHLMEFWMIEPEVAFAELDDIMKLAEDLISYLVAARPREARRRTEASGTKHRALSEKVRPPFPRISYSEAFDILEKEGAETQRGADLGAPDETILSSKYELPLMVHRYPKDVKAFYMQPDPQNPDVALCVDVLAPEGYGEIIGGSQRIHDHDLLLKRIKEHNLPIEAFQWYLDLQEVRDGSSQRVRHGNRTSRGLDLRPRARARDDSIPKNAV